MKWNGSTKYTSSSSRVLLILLNYSIVPSSFFSNLLRNDSAVGKSSWSRSARKIPLKHIFQTPPSFSTVVGTLSLEMFGIFCHCCVQFLPLLRRKRIFLPSFICCKRSQFGRWCSSFVLVSTCSSIGKSIFCNHLLRKRIQRFPATSARPLCMRILTYLFVTSMFRKDA